MITIEDIEPCLKKVEYAMKKVRMAIEKQGLKCDQCEFEARNANGLNMHKKAKHTNNTQQLFWYSFLYFILSFSNSTYTSSV